MNKTPSTSKTTTSITELLARLEVLHNVLVYCSEVEKLSFGKNMVFTTLERIVINQERGSLFSQIAGLRGEAFPSQIRYAVTPDHIEAKVKFATEKIQASNWGGYDNDKFLKTE